MRRHDLEALESPYSPPTRYPGDRFADALGIKLGDVRALENALQADLDTTIFGIGWWKAYEPGFGARARIYVSDYLFRSAASIETNLIEAKLHLLEALDAYEQEDARLARMVQLGPDGRPHPKHPPSRNAKDDLQQHLATMHTAGFFRALASAFDCLGACIQGVLALNGWIVSASLGTARGALKNLSSAPTRDVERKAFRSSMEAIIAAAGPAGWLEWALDYRHTLVHRARRFELTSLELESTVVDPRGRPILLTRQIPQLARDPGRTDVEVWRDVKTPPVLTEAARTTMEEILKSGQHTLSSIAALLLEFWQWRKTDPSRIVQPGGQWPNNKAGDITGFEGYEPKQSAYHPSMMMASPVVTHRMQAASLVDGSYSNWPVFAGHGDNR